MLSLNLMKPGKSISIQCPELRCTYSQHHRPMDSFDLCSDLKSGRAETCRVVNIPFM